MHSLQFSSVDTLHVLFCFFYKLSAMHKVTNTFFFSYWHMLLTFWILQCIYIPCVPKLGWEKSRRHKPCCHLIMKRHNTFARLFHRNSVYLMSLTMWTWHLWPYPCPVLLLLNVFQGYKHFSICFTMLLLNFNTCCSQEKNDRKKHPACILGQPSAHWLW